MKINMPRFSVFLLCVIGLFWFIPNFYTKAFKTDRFQLGGSFSPISKEFIIWESSPEKFTNKNEKDEELNRMDAQKMLPFLFYNSINKWGAFPLSSIDGVNITYDMAKHGSQMLRLSPRIVSTDALPLHVLFESSPLGVSLEMPSDILLVKSDGFVFIDCISGAINEEKSQSFTKAAKDGGVLFPILKASTNPSAMKPFDEGMFFADSANRLFQLKMIKGEPFVKQISEAIDKKILHISVNEDERKLFYGSVVTEDSAYINTYDEGLRKLPLANYNPKTTSMTAYFASMYHSIILGDLSVANYPSQYVAVTENFDIAREYQKNLPQNVIKQKEYISYGLSFLTPFYITQFDSFSNEVLLNIKFASNTFTALFGILFALILYVVVNFKKRFYIADLAAICLTGIPGFIALLIFGSFAKKD
ncbi:MAG: DUF4857 domain-containing protein [Campylobacteraceae bacterium]|jgi:hypothetical protein|nr:DUF4857 domain-containing protein [Campylobacteraceae bacterium]